MSELLQTLPCSRSDGVLNIVNAVFAGIQMLLLTWMGTRVSNMAHTQHQRLQREINHSGVDPTKLG